MEAIPGVGVPGSKPASVEKRPRSVERVNDDVMAMVLSIMQLLCKLGLKQELEIRELQAVALVMVVIRKDVNEVQEAQNAMTKFEEDLKSAKSSGDDPEKLGLKSIIMWCKLVTTLSRNEEIPIEFRQPLIDHRDAITSTKMLEDKVLICKFKKAWDKNTTKIAFACHRDVEPIQEAIIMALSKIPRAQMKRKRGQAAQGGLARELQDKLAVLQKMSES